MVSILLDQYDSIALLMWRRRLLFTVTTALVAMDVMRNRNSSSIKPANNMEAHNGV